MPQFIHTVSDKELRDFYNVRRGLKVQVDDEFGVGGVPEGAEEILSEIRTDKQERYTDRLTKLFTNNEITEQELEDLTAKVKADTLSDDKKRDIRDKLRVLDARLAQRAATPPAPPAPGPAPKAAPKAVAKPPGAPKLPVAGPPVPKVVPKLPPVPRTPPPGAKPPAANPPAAKPPVKRPTSKPPRLSSPSNTQGNSPSLFCCKF